MTTTNAVLIFIVGYPALLVLTYWIMFCITRWIDDRARQRRLTAGRKINARNAEQAESHGGTWWQ